MKWRKRNKNRPKRENVLLVRKVQELDDLSRDVPAQIKGRTTRAGINSSQRVGKNQHVQTAQCFQSTL